MVGPGGAHARSRTPSTPPPPRSWILTHDFTHRTHAVVFGFQYPRSLPDWSSDDWVTLVYEQFKLKSVREDAPVVHTLSQQRYIATDRNSRLLALNAELASGATTLVAWAQEAKGITLAFSPIVSTCC